jgi:transaldolase
MAKNPQISAINELGQSIWYDNVSKGVLNSGELKSIIDLGVSGLTSNPSIFKKAIADSNDYDAEMKALADKGLHPEQICEELMLQDIAVSADLLRPIYDATAGGDGYASIEVSPNLARDTAGSIEAARRLWAKLNRPNVMVKIPGTKEGIPAIRAALEDGININVTLLFSDQAYRAVAEAYIEALEKRAAAGKEIQRISSVASFFVSRVDAICEKSFDELLKAGKVKVEDRKSFEALVGIANSRVAYCSFQELFGAERFKRLERLGARVQRPLWASTGTKNPAFSPVLYVEELIGRDTVNTMPPATLQALMSRATIEPRLYQDRESAFSIIQSVNNLGIKFDELMVVLEQDGVKIFADAYTELLQAIATKLAKLR